MKTIFFRKNHPKEGYTSLVSKENTYLNDLEIGRLRLGKKGDKFSGHTKNHELLFEILIGTCDITTKHNDSVKKFHDMGNRKNVFDSEPDSLPEEPGASSAHFSTSTATPSSRCWSPTRTTRSTGRSTTAPRPSRPKRSIWTSTSHTGFHVPLQSVNW